MKLLIYIILLLSPMPFASARPSWQWMWVCIIGLMALQLSYQSLTGSLPQLPKRLHRALWLVGAVVLLGLAQAFLPLGFLDTSSTESSKRLMTDVLSFNPSETLSTTIFFLAHLVFFLGIYSACQQGLNPIRFLRNLGFIVTFYALYGFIIYVSGNKYILWYDKWINLENLTSTFVNRNHFAAYAGLGLLCLLSHATILVQISAKARAHRYIYLFTKHWFVYASVFLISCALVLSGSRGGVISSLIAAVSFLFLIFINRSNNPNHIDLKFFFGAGILIIFGVLVFSGDVLLQRLSATDWDGQRIPIFYDTLRATEDYFWLGSGLGTFEDAFRAYRSANIEAVFIRNAHNDYLELLLTAGIIVTILLVLGFWNLTLTFWHSSGNSLNITPINFLGIAAIAQIAIHSLIDFPIQIPAVSFLWAAILAACSSQVSSSLTVET